MSATIAGLESLDQVLDRAKFRKEHRVDMEFSRAADLGLHWREEGRGQSAGFYARIDGRDMQLTDSGVHTAMKLVKGKPEFFKQSPDPNAFPKWFRNVVDAPGREGKLLVRSDGVKIEAVLPDNYQIRDSYDVLSDFGSIIENEVGDIQGVLSLEKNNGSACSYRIVCGNNILKNLEDSRGQYMMFSLRNSETGMRNMTSQLGLFRTICTNSAIPGMAHAASWDHKRDESGFNNKVSKIIRQTGYYRNAFETLFSEMLKTKLPDSAEVILKSLFDNKDITKAHFEASRNYAIGLTEDGEPHRNWYDLHNAMTRAAQDLPSLSAREKAEEAALDIFISGRARQNGKDRSNDEIETEIA